MNIDNIISILIILGLANGAPILAARVFDEWFSMPIDGGRLAPDGYPWLGSSKTWRGIVSAYLFALPVAVWLGFSAASAFIIISLSMCGDLCSSFIKRRRKMTPSSRAIGLDQIPEAGLPVVFLWFRTSLTGLDSMAIVILFIIIEVVISRLLFRLHIRKRPY